MSRKRMTVYTTLTFAKTVEVDIPDYDYSPHAIEAHKTAAQVIAGTFPGAGWVTDGEPVFDYDYAEIESP